LTTKTHLEEHPMARIATSTKPPLDPGGFRHSHQEHSGGFRHNHQTRSDPAAPAGSVRSGGWRARWPAWVPYAAALWSFGIAGMALVWVLTGSGYPLGANGSNGTDSAFDTIASEAGSRGFLFGSAAAGVLSLIAARGWSLGRWNSIGVAVLGVLGVVLLVLVPDSQLLVLLGYSPIFLVGAPFGWPPVSYVDQLTWTVGFQALSVMGGLLLVATALAWRRRARNACRSCGRAAAAPGWTTPKAAAAWGRWASLVAVVVPAMYAINRLAWVAGIPLGISQEFLDEMWSSGLVWAALGLGTFAALGAVLTLGLVQRWGEVFPRWMVGLAGKRVPPLLAEIPAALVAILVTSASVPLVIGVGEMGDVQDDLGWIQTLLMGAFPVWGLALRAATLAYHLRRRGTCQSCQA